MPNTTLRTLPVLGAIDDWLRRKKFAKQKQHWLAQGKPLPVPHLVKQETIAEHAQRFGTRVMVETGTFHGDMCQAMQKHFEQIYTIELSEPLFAAACKRFKNNTAITCLQGDSGVKIKDVLDQLDEPALFWLDGHYSAGATARADHDTPISQELEHVLAHHVHDHVILIDDARCFTGENGYPELDQLREHLLAQRPDWSFDVQTDCIRFTPPTRGSGT